MGQPEEHLTTRETVLAVVEAAGGRQVGRTVVQKLTYFAGYALEQDFRHRPYFYGPYSRAVESALNNSVFAGDLSMTIKSTGTVRTYEYELTDQGSEALSEIEEGHPSEVRQVRDVVCELANLIPNLPQRPLSLAAKVDLIVRQRKKGGMDLSGDEIPSMAKSLGWDLSDEEIDQAKTVLNGLQGPASLETA